MSYLETKRNAIMNSVSGGISNLLDGVEYLEDYFINSSGVITPNPTPETKVIVFDYIEIEPNARYIYRDIFDTSQLQYTHYAMYDENKNLLGTRTTIVNSVNADKHSAILTVTNASAKYIRLNPRTFGDIGVGLYKLDDIDLPTINISY
jgi:hypothetical protein